MIKKINFREEPWLTYLFSGFYVEFGHSGILLTDLNNRKKWKIALTYDPNNPFIITLEERE